MALPTVKAFEAKHLRGGRPVVLRGLLKGSALAKLDTEAKVEKALGSMLLTLKRHYHWTLMEGLLGPDGVEAFARGTGITPGPAPAVKTLGDFLKFLRAKPGLRDWWCSGEAAAPALIEAAGTPEYCTYNATGRPDDLIRHVFVGGKGVTAPLHFDPDHRHVILYHVFGRKRMTLLPPSASKALAAQDNLSLFLIQNLSDKERAALLARLGGLEFVLEPGDALYTPPLWWHTATYLDTAMSLGFRFGRNAYGLWLADHLHKDLHLQNVSSLFVDDKKVGAGEKAAYERLRAAYAKEYASPLEKYNAIQALGERLYAELCPDAPQGTWWMPVVETLREKRLAETAERTYGEKKELGSARVEAAMR